MQNSPDVMQKFSRDYSLSDQNAGEPEQGSEPNHVHPSILRPDLLPVFVDPANWVWEAQSRARWTPDKGSWRDFCDIWYGAMGTQSTALADPKSPSLSLGPIPGLGSWISSSVLIRDSYVTLFDAVWAQ
ncbi:hypothetical protein CVT25_014676 [Psilocybe cyanescens]|uniref:Uncharacterized protein n=1 Tax=Psilocybe cyanescens TaxID=93625 RepID=A0A409X8Y7_PSICY|nr:hypothetical protein CVT25_014676 [Psilocybe cyanescens]